MNPDIDLSFLESERESTLARWKVCLEEEELLTSARLPRRAMMVEK